MELWNGFLQRKPTLDFQKYAVEFRNYTVDFLTNAVNFLEIRDRVSEMETGGQ